MRPSPPPGATRRHAAPRAAGQLLLAALAAAAAHAESIADCRPIADDAARLACYDRAARPAAPPAPTAAVAPIPGQAPARDASPRPVAAAGVVAPAEGITLSTVWELDAADKRGTFRLVPHRLNYLLPVRYSTSVNRMPRSPAEGHATATGMPLGATEAKFQFSVKFKAFENLLGDNGDLWLGYTQQSNWQLYNPGLSSPFRSSDHEPEAMLVLRTDADVLGWRWRLLDLGIVHQSNGRSLPQSRSWNRVYAQFGFERGDFTLLARPWVRLPERSRDDDNPDIGDYMGSGDLRLAWQRGGHVYSLLGRYSLSGRRGGAQFDWAFPISGALRGYVQATRGYGETLIDYNHSQTTLGAGLLLLPWQ